MKKIVNCFILAIIFIFAMSSCSKEIDNPKKPEINVLKDVGTYFLYNRLYYKKDTTGWLVGKLNIKNDKDSLYFYYQIDSLYSWYGDLYPCDLKNVRVWVGTNLEDVPFHEHGFVPWPDYDKFPYTNYNGEYKSNISIPISDLNLGDTITNKTIYVFVYGELTNPFTGDEYFWAFDVRNLERQRYFEAHPEEDLYLDTPYNYLFLYFTLM